MRQRIKTPHPGQVTASIVLPGRFFMRSRPFFSLSFGVFVVFVLLWPITVLSQIPNERGLRSEQAEPSTSRERVDLQFPGNPVEDVLAHYVRLTGKTLIRDANLAGVNLSIIATGVEREEAIRIIESSLLLNGYVFVPVDERSVKIINVNAGKNPRTEGLPLYANASLLPEAEQIVSFFMPLQFMTPEEAMNIFLNHAPPRPNFGGVVPVNNAQALLVTESTTVIRKLVALKNLVDVPPAQVTTEFIQLTQADATTVAEQLTKLLETRANSSTTTSTSRGTSQPIDPAELEMITEASAPSIGPTEKSLVTGETQIVADPRTNRILVVTRPSNISYLRALIRQFDEATVLNEPFERPLQHIKATEVLQLIADLLRSKEDQVEVQRGESTAAGSTPTSTLGGGAGLTGRQGGFGGAGTAGGFQEVELPAVESARIGTNITLVADNRANSILVIAPPEAKQKAKLLLDRLDKRPQQVFLSVLIGQFTLRQGEQYSFDYLLRTVTDGTHTAAGLLRTREGPIFRLNDLADPEAFPLTGGLTLYGSIDQTLDIFANALERTNRFNVLARPTVYTTNNKKAVISSGQRVAVPTSTLTDTASTGNVSTSFVSNIGYQEVLLSLDVIPLINEQKEVTLQIVQRNDSIIGTTNISGNDIPNIGTQEIITTVTIPDRSTVVLGGLIQDSTNKDRSGLPWLSRVPVLGFFLRRTSDARDRTELVVMIQPTVVSNIAEGLAASEMEQLRTSPGRDIWLNEPFPPQFPTPRRAARGPRR